MIRYDVTLEAVEAAVDLVDQRWRKKAGDRTDKLVAAGQYREQSSIWSDVKPVFMTLQKNKCVFCERQFESEIHGKIEFDLEHFRPKSSVVGWPDPARHAQAYDFATGGASVTGYYWLAYHLRNYAASCKVCNSNLKSNFFPIAGARWTGPGDEADEAPYLCYPLGSEDADPEQLITFIGTTAVPKAHESMDRRRGQVMIDFFDLNRREELHRQRASMIILLGGALRNIELGVADDADAELAARIVDDIYPHTNCLRAFRSMWDEQRDLALDVLHACKLYYASVTGSPPPAVGID